MTRKEELKDFVIKGKMELENLEEVYKNRQVTTIVPSYFESCRIKQLINDVAEAEKYLAYLEKKT